MDTIDTVRELKEVLDFGFSLQSAIADAKADGKVNWLDMPKAIPVIGKAAKAINGTVDAVKDYKNLLPAQQAELFAYVEERLDLPDDQLENLIEDTILEVQHIFDLSNRWATYAKKPRA